MSHKHAPKKQRSGAALITAERRHQIHDKGHTAEYDDEHSYDTFSGMRKAYLETARYLFSGTSFARAREHGFTWWPFRSPFNPPTTATACLVKAGAVTAAQIDWLNRRTEAGSAP